MLSQPIDFHPPTEDSPVFLLPNKGSVFADRAARFAALAEEHSLGDWLRFLGKLTAAQHEALQSLPTLPLPDAAALELARNHAMPPLNISSMPRPAVWRDVLRQIACSLRNDAPTAAQQALDQLSQADDERLEKLAEQILVGEPSADDSAALPFVAAALQVVWTALAGQLDSRHLQKLDAHGVCPCCGSLPVASLVRLSPSVNNLRYLHCSLCNSEWNVSRAVCTACGSDQGIAQQQIEGGKDSMRAETCDSCKSYLKIAYQAKEPLVDPVADDLATLALDMLVDEAGFARSGPNLFLIGASGEA